MEPPREHFDGERERSATRTFVLRSFRTCRTCPSPLRTRSCTRGAEYPARSTYSSRDTDGGPCTPTSKYVFVPNRRRDYITVTIPLASDFLSSGHSLSRPDRERGSLSSGGDSWQQLDTEVEANRHERDREYESRNTHDDRRPTTDNGYAASESSWKGGGRREGGHVRGKRGGKREKERSQGREQRDITREAAGRNVGGGRGNRKRDGGKEAMNGDSRTRGRRRKSEKRW